MGGGLDPPLSVILSWKSNYINPVTHGNGIIIMEGVLLALCYVTVGLRVYTRAIQGKNFGIDDTLIVFNLIPLTGLATGLILAFTRYGWNRHIYDIPPSMLVNARKDSMTIEVTYLISTCTTKISILLFYRRVGGAVSPRIRYAIYTALTFVLLYMLTYLIYAFVQCQPLNAYWNRANIYWLAANQGKWKCTDEATAIVVASVISVVQDFIACLLPMALFVRLRISRKQKIALAGIFGIGFFLCICGVLRLIASVKVYYQTYDITWESLDVWVMSVLIIPTLIILEPRKGRETPLASHHCLPFFLSNYGLTLELCRIWTGIESHMAVVCASLPALHHFFRHVLIESSMASGFKSWSNQNSRSASIARSKGYGQTISRTGSENVDDTRRPTVHLKAMHITEDMKLEDFLNDKRYDLFHEPAERSDWARGTNFDEETLEPTTTSWTWLEDDTSEDDSPSRKPEGASRKYSGFADSRRFYEWER